MLLDFLSRAGLSSRRQALKMALWLLRKVYDAESRHAARISSKIDRFDDENVVYDHSLIKAFGGRTGDFRICPGLPYVPFR